MSEVPPSPPALLRPSPLALAMKLLATALLATVALTEAADLAVDRTKLADKCVSVSFFAADFTARRLRTRRHSVTFYRCSQVLGPRRPLRRRRHQPAARRLQGAGAQPAARHPLQAQVRSRAPDPESRDRRRQSVDRWHRELPHALAGRPRPQARLRVVADEGGQGPQPEHQDLRPAVGLPGLGRERHRVTLRRRRRAHIQLYPAVAQGCPRGLRRRDRLHRRLERALL